MPREPVEDRLDEYEHFGNRRLRTVGELIQEAFRIGLYRMERVVRERLTTEDADTITPADDHQHPPGRGGPEGVLRVLAAVAVHGPDQLALRPHAPAPPVGARRRRAHARARADRGARRAPDPLRPHVPDRDAGGAEHRPDRLALVASPRSPSTASSRRPTGWSRTASSPTRSSTSTPRGGGAGDRAGERRARPQDRQAQGPAGHLPLARRRARDRRAQGRRPDGRLADADLVGGHGADPVPRARRRQPRPDGLEHAAPGRAAAEDRRRRWWAPAWSAAPRSTPATWSLRRGAGEVSYVDAERIVVDARRTSTSSTSSCAPTRAR